MIYTPADDSFLLQKHVRRYAPGKSVLDMGTGSGILAEAAMDAFAGHVLAVDVNIEAVERLSLRDFEVRRSDLFSNVDEKFDVIVFNPPYLPPDAREDADSAKITTGGTKGDEVILDFLHNVKQHMERGGVVLLVLSSLTPRERIETLLKQKDLLKTVLETKALFMETLEVWELRRTKEQDLKERIRRKTMDHQELLQHATELHRATQETEEQLRLIDEQIADLEQFVGHAQALEGSAGSEILASVGRGLHVRAKLVDTDLFVEVGAGVVVKKTATETKEVIRDQLRKFKEARLQLLQQLEMHTAELGAMLTALQQIRKNA